jgi:HK97 family phage major capsid protein
MPVDINRSTTGVMLPPDVSNEIWGATLEESAVMQFARRISLPGRGVSVPIVTGEPEANWVSETEVKPVSRGTLGNKLITPYTLAVIEPFSNQFRRDVPALYSELVRRLPFALAKKFDATVFGPASGAPGSNFDTLGGTAAIGIATDTYDALVAVDAAVSTADGILSGWVMAPQAKALLLTTKDSTGRPLFINNAQTDGAVPALLGSPVHIRKAVYDPGKPAVAGNPGTPGVPAQLGFAGDWSDAVYGTVSGVQIAVSDQATLKDGDTTINLFQQNMFAVRAEIEVGFRVKDPAEFVRLTGTIPTA